MNADSQAIATSNPGSTLKSSMQITGRRSAPTCDVDTTGDGLARKSAMTMHSRVGRGPRRADGRAIGTYELLVRGCRRDGTGDARRHVLELLDELRLRDVVHGWTVVARQNFEAGKHGQPRTWPEEFRRVLGKAAGFAEEFDALSQASGDRSVPALIPE